MYILFNLFLLVVFFTGNDKKEVSMTSATSCCQNWQAKVNPNIEKKLVNEINEKTLDDKELLEGIECLLKLEGNESISNLGGAVNLQVSQTFGPTEVQTSALFYISYLYYGKWEHANAIALVEGDNDINSPQTIKKAYESYKKWFKKVKEVGLEEARKQKIDPLEGSGVRWY